MFKIFNKKNSVCANCNQDINSDNVIENYGQKFCSSKCMEEFANKNKLNQDLPSCCSK